LGEFAAADEVQDMFSEAARGLAALEVSATADVLPLKLSPAGTPSLLALLVQKYKY